MRPNDPLALIGAVIVIVGGILGHSYALTGFAILAALAMALVVLLPSLAPGLRLPRTHGSLMLAIGGVAAAAMVLSLIIAGLGLFVGLRDLLFLAAVAGGLVMAWAGWRELSDEGGTFSLSWTDAGSAGPTTPDDVDPPGRA